MLIWRHAFAGHVGRFIRVFQNYFHLPKTKMTNRAKRAAQHGFTLIELLIVVIILAILAAIVIPQFSNSTKDAQEATMDANLAAMRSAIELYKVQHNGVYPGANAATGGTCPTGGVAGAGTAGGAQAFIDQLTAASDGNGATCTVADPTYRFGPYLRGAVPNDPISGKGSLPAEISITTTGAAFAAPGAATGGYKYDTKSGQLMINSNATDVKSKAYSTH